MKTTSFQEDSVWKISNKIKEMITSGEISEIISVTLSSVLIAYDVVHYCIIIYK